ncbi:hypothetical protein ACN47E_000704 [Coniothyrium glycines]
MPHKHFSKIADGHLIFAKNVPHYMSDRVTHIFADYKPLGIKNVYPHGDMTTLVISFRTVEQAERAQQDTDQLRLDHVILRVEGFSKKQSIRALRQQQRKGSRPVAESYDDGGGGVDDGYEEAAEEYFDEHDTTGSSTPVDDAATTLATSIDKQAATQVPHTAQATTWADIAAKHSPSATLIPPAPPKHCPHATPPMPTVPRAHLSTHTPPPAHPTPGKPDAAVPYPPPRPVPRAPRHSQPCTPPRHPAGPHPPLLAPATTSVTQDHGASDQDQDSREATRPLPVATPAASVLAPVDTTQAIRERHCRGCAFCVWTRARGWMNG